MEEKLICMINSEVGKLRESLNGLTDSLNDGSVNGAIGAITGEESTIAELICMLRILRECK
jgi:hypothetical protein